MKKIILLLLCLTVTTVIQAQQTFKYLFGGSDIIPVELMAYNPTFNHDIRNNLVEVDYGGKKLIFKVLSCNFVIPDKNVYKVLDITNMPAKIVERSNIITIETTHILFVLTNQVPEILPKK